MDALRKLLAINPRGSNQSQLNRKAFKKACAQGWNAQPGKAGLNSRAQKGMGPNKASGHKGGISRQRSKRG